MYQLIANLKENYEDSHTSRIFATVDMPADAKVNFPTYIYCDRFYDHEYQEREEKKNKNYILNWDL